MTPRWSALAWLFPPAALLLAVLSLAVGDNAHTAASVAGSVIPLVFALAGAVIASRRPRNGIGWFLCLFSLNIPAEGAMVGMVAGGASGRAAVWGLWAVSWVWAPMLAGLLTYLPLSFPHGRVTGRPAKLILGAAAIGVAMIVAGNAFSPTPLEMGIPNPLGVRRWGALTGILIDLGQVLTLGAGLVSVALSARRFRRSIGIERQQLKWFVSGIALVVAGATANAVLYQLGNPTAGQIVVGAGFVWLPVALGVGILRHRLYDIDRLISRTVSYVLVTAVVVGVYLLAVTTLTALTSDVVGSSPIAVAASTLAAAAAFGPVRRRIQGSVDRRFNRASYDAARAAEAYRARLRDQLELGTIGEDLVATVSTTVQPSSSLLWLSNPGGQR